MREADIQAFLDTLRSGWLTMGPKIAQFEQEFAAHVGAPLAVAVSSGTSALHLVVRALAQAGDEVIVPAIGGNAAANAVTAAGAVPVVCDVLPDRPTLDPEDAQRRVTDKTAAIVAVHAYGFTSAVPDLGLPVIEDARGALGTGAGTQGVAACWSFADGRAIAMGEGGMITTADRALADRARLLRAHAMTSGTWDRHRGHSDAYDVVDVGFNFRLDEPRAALGSALLSHFEPDPQPTAFLVEDVPAVVEKLRSAGIASAPARPLADRPNAAAQRLVVLAPGEDPAAATRTLRAG